MQLSYIDESGDDGKAPGCSPLFVLAEVTISETDWAMLAGELRELRMSWESRLGIPRWMELHTKALLLRKRPYDRLGLDSRTVSAAIGDLAMLMANGQASFRSWVLDKAVGEGSPLRDTLLPLVERAQGRCRLYVSDRGRVPAMRRIMDEAGEAWQKGGLIEEILELDSARSPFIQLADVMATASHLLWSERLGYATHARLHEGVRRAALGLAEGPNRESFLVRPWSPPRG